jgi:hypothetical protein
MKIGSYVLCKFASCSYPGWGGALCTALHSAAPHFPPDHCLALHALPAGCRRCTISCLVCIVGILTHAGQNNADCTSILSALHRPHDGLIYVLAPDPWVKCVLLPRIRWHFCW